MATNADEKPGSKQVYIRSMAKNLLWKKAQLAFVKRKMGEASQAGRIEISEQLRNAEKRADNALAVAEERLQQLRDASDESWEDQKPGADIAWEDLSHSVKTIVARFSS